MKNLKLKAHGYLLITLVMVLSFAFLSSVEAMQLKLEDVTDPLNPFTKIIDDNGIGDMNPAIGKITYMSDISGDIGIFDTVVSTGITKPVIGSEAVPKIDLNTVTVNSSSAGTLLISVSETDFGPMGGGLSGFTTWLGGTTDGSVSLDAYFDSTNVLFGTETQIADMGPFSTGPLSGADAYSGTPVSSPFSLSIVVDVTHTDGGQTTSYDAHIKPVPEPGTLLLLGLGLLGLGASRRRKTEIEG